MKIFSDAHLRYIIERHDPSIFFLIFLISVGLSFSIFRFFHILKNCIEEPDHKSRSGNDARNQKHLIVPLADPLKNERADTHQSRQNTDDDLDREQTANADTEANPRYVKSQH